MAEFENPDLDARPNIALDPRVRTVRNFGPELLDRYLGVHIENPPVAVPLDAANCSVIYSDPRLRAWLGIGYSDLFWQHPRNWPGVLSPAHNAYFFWQTQDPAKLLYVAIHDSTHSFIFEKDPTILMEDFQTSHSIAVSGHLEEGIADWTAHEVAGRMLNYTLAERSELHRSVIEEDASNNKPRPYFEGHDFVRRAMGPLMGAGLKPVEALTLMIHIPPIKPGALNHPEEYAHSIIETYYLRLDGTFEPI